MNPWLMAIRPKTLTASLAPIAVATAISYRHQPELNWALVWCAIGCTLCLQIVSNLVNDVADFKKGTDSPDRLGPIRVTAQGLLSPKAVWVGAIISILGAIGFGIPLLIAGGLPITLLGLFSIMAAVCYTAGPYPLAYHGLGEIFVFIFFGLVAVVGLVFCLTGETIPGAWLAGVQLGFLSVVMIAINNLRDIEGDKKNHKHTLAARFGEGFMRKLITFALLAPYVLGAAWYKVTPWAFALPFIAAPIRMSLTKTLRHTPPSKAMNPLLGKASLHLLVFSLILAVALVWK